MARVKRGTIKNKTRRNVLARTKGFRHGRKSKKRMAKTAILKAESYAFRDRRAKKRTMRRTAIMKVNAAVRALGFKNYSTFIGGAKKKGIELNRTVLAQLAEHQPEVFERTMKEMTK